MKLRFNAFILSAFAAAALLTANVTGVRAQESEPVVVDEVIAQVNNDVVTLSMLKREMREAIETFKQQGVNEQKATEEVARRQPEVIASLVNEHLLVQKAKELGMAEEIEAEVNKEMLRVAKEQNITTMEQLETALRQAGLDPAGIRKTLRVQFTKQAVLSREVDAKIYFGLSQDELKKHYAQHPDKFRKPETVTVSEIFLSLAGRPEAEVKAKAQQLLQQARAAGADFGTLAAANSEREIGGQRVAPQTKGKVGTFQTADLRPDVAAAIRNLKAGAISELVRTDEGYQILRVDERTAAGNASAFNEDQVRQAIMMERRDKERETYMQALRKDSYIKINGTYKASVEPLLSTGPATGTSSAGTTPGNSTTAPAARNTNGGSGNNRRP